jgi:hypothetical protein
MPKQKKLASSKSTHQLLFVLVLLLAVLAGGLFVEANSLSNKLDKTKDDQTLLYNEIDYQKSLLRPVVLPKENLVVFPELKISLPYNDVTKTFQYTVDNQRGVQLGITSTLLTDHKMRQLSCSELVSVNQQDGIPFSPWEETAGTIKLADGRTLYLIAAKAFKNNEASSLECASEVWHQITPQQVVDEFKKAQTY